MQVIKHIRYCKSLLLIIFLYLSFSELVHKTFAESVIQDTWPEAPSHISNDLYSAGEKPNTKVPLVAIDTPTIGAPPLDPMELLDGDSVKGIILDSPYLTLPDYVDAQHYFAMYGVGISKNIGTQKSNVVSYHTKSYGYNYDPQFSPDGGKLLYKNGWPFDSGSSFGICIWDFKNKTIESVGQAVTWTRVQWSPNSRYIAYVTGGDPSGMRKGDDDRIDLMVYDMQDQKNYTLAKDVAAQVLMADQQHYYVRKPGTYRTYYWTLQNTLLFTKQREMTAEENKNRAEEPPRPDICEVSVPGGASQKLISKGTNPVSSPDGKTIAFFGWSDLVDRIVPKEDAKADEDDVPKVVPPSLYLFNRASKTRTKLADMNKGILVWAPDGTSLYVLHLVDGSKPNTGRIGQLDKIDMSNYKLTTIAQTAAKDADGKPRNYSRFYNLDISRNGKYAILDASYDLGFDRFTETDMKTFLRVDLTTGKVNNVAFCLNKWASVLGWDWHDMSEPAK